MRKPILLGEILEKVVVSCGQDQATREKLENGLKENRIFAIWEDAVGETLASNARPDQIHKGNLTVFVSDSAWMQELQFLKPEIKKKLNKKLGRGIVRDIRFKIGETDINGKPERNTKALDDKSSRNLSVIDSKTLSAIDEHVREIKDPGVRESVRNYLIASSTSSVQRNKRRE